VASERLGRGAKPSPVEPGKLRIIARIEQLEVIARILSHLERTAPQPHPPELPLGARAPPAAGSGSTHGPSRE